MKTFSEYKYLFAHLPVNKKGSMIAPHKAILLLTVIDLIERGIITTPCIPLSEELQRNFKRMWKTYVPLTCPFTCKFSYPFFHLSSSPFWILIKASTYIGQKEYSSIKPLKRDYIGAVIDTELFQYLSNPGQRDELRELLIANYLVDNNSHQSSQLGKAILLAIFCAVA